MTVNFQQLSPIQAPQVVANLPNQQLTSPLQQLGGALQGIAKGQQDATAAADTHDINQMNLKLGGVKLEGDKIDLQDKQQKQADAKTMREAAKSGWENYVKVGMRTDPVTTAGTMKIYNDAKIAEAQIDQVKGVTTKQGMENKDQIVHDIGGIAATTSSLQVQDKQTGQMRPANPQEKAEFYNKGISILPEEAQVIAKKLAPNGYDGDGTGVVLATMGTMAAANIADKQKGTKEFAPSDKMKSAKRISELETLQNPTPAEQSELKSLKQQTAPPRYVNTPADTALTATYSTELTRINKEKAAAPEFYGRIAETRKSLEATPDILQGPVGQNMAWLNKNAQTLMGNTNALVGQIKNIQNWGSQGFTDADRKFVAAMVGGIANYKGSTEELLTQMETLRHHADRYNWIQENRIMSGTQDYESWKNSNPEPTVQIKTSDGQKLELPITQLPKLQKDHPKEKFEVTN